MMIKYNDHENSIRIDDGAKYQYFLIKMSVVFTILTSVLMLYNLSDNHFRMMGFIWIFIGVSITIMFLYIFLKKSYEECIKPEEIAFLKEKEVFGKRRLSLQLTNGKVRDILIKNPAEVSEIKKFFEELIRTL